MKHTAPAMFTCPPRRPATRTTGRAPRSAHVRPSAGSATACSRPRSRYGRPGRARYFYPRPHLGLPHLDRRLVPFQRPTDRRLAAPAMPPQPPHPLDRVADVEQPPDQPLHALERPALVLVIEAVSQRAPLQLPLQPLPLRRRQPFRPPSAPPTPALLLHPATCAPTVPSPAAPPRSAPCPPRPRAPRPPPPARPPASPAPRASARPLRIPHKDVVPQGSPLVTTARTSPIQPEYRQGIPLAGRPSFAPEISFRLGETGSSPTRPATASRTQRLQQKR